MRPDLASQTTVVWSPEPAAKYALVFDEEEDDEDDGAEDDEGSEEEEEEKFDHLARSSLFSIPAGAPSYTLIARGSLLLFEFAGYTGVATKGLMFQVLTVESILFDSNVWLSGPTSKEVIELVCPLSVNNGFSIANGADVDWPLLLAWFESEDWYELRERGSQAQMVSSTPAEKIKDPS